jgi:hypothetical protein
MQETPGPQGFLGFVEDEEANGVRQNIYREYRAIAYIDLTPSYNYSENTSTSSTFSTTPIIIAFAV